MKKNIIIIVLSAFLLVSCSNDTAQGQLKKGTYIEGSQGFSSIILKDDYEFDFNLHVASSYLPIGTYVEEDNKLVLTDDEGKVYEFLIDGEKLVLDNEINTGIRTGYEGQGEEYILEKGMEFVYTE